MLSPEFHFFSLLFTIAGLGFPVSVKMAFTPMCAHIEDKSSVRWLVLSLSTLFIDTGGFTEPGPHTLARLTGHQALRTLLSLPHVFGVIVTFFHTGFFPCGFRAFANTVIASALVLIYYFSLIQLKLWLSIYFYGHGSN